MTYESLQRLDVLSQALWEIVASQSWSQLEVNPTLQVESLCQMPLLQSMYAETLRLYTSLFALRSAPHGDLDFCRFTIPKDELVAVDSRVAAMDASIWNTGPTNTDHPGYHPLDSFWAERFLVYPNAPQSGPL